MHNAHTLLLAVVGMAIFTGIRTWWRMMMPVLARWIYGTPCQLPHGDYYPPDHVLDEPEEHTTCGQCGGAAVRHAAHLCQGGAWRWMD